MIALVTQKNHWAKEVNITIAKSNTRCLARPDFQPEQVERVLQIPGAGEGKIWAICALRLPPGLLFSPLQGRSVSEKDCSCKR